MREKIMWLIILAVSLITAFAGAIYLSRKIEKTGLFSKVENRTLVTALSVLTVVALLFVISRIFDATNTVIIVVHLAVFLLLGDLVRFIIARTRGVNVSERITDVAAIAVCVVYFIIGWILMHGLWETDYDLYSGKEIGHLRIAHIADSHIGCGFDGEGFAERLLRIQETEPDMLVITGDFVDDDTMKDDMLRACEALGSFKSKYGVFFCFGNHDRGYYSSEKRGYDGDELAAQMEKNGVTVLRDESVLVDGRFYIIGRNDAGFGDGGRAEAADLVKDLDKDIYMIMLDHQPTDYDAETAAGVDLVLSGHTHGGQLFPLAYIQPIISSNDKVRGLEHRDNTDFIVTDGISDWAIKFRTGCRSEFNVIDIWQERK